MERALSAFSFLTCALVWAAFAYTSARYHATWATATACCACAVHLYGAARSLERPRKETTR